MDNFSIEVNRYIMDCNARQLRRKTMKQYEKSLILFKYYISDNFKIDDVSKVTAEHIRSYIAYLRKRGKYEVIVVKNPINHPQNRKDRGQKIAPRTIANYVKDIKLFFKYLYSEQIIRKDPSAKIKDIKAKRRKTPLISESDLHMLMRQFDVSTFHGYRNWMITRLILDTGMRVSECLSLYPNNVDLHSHAIFIPAIVTKSNKDRFVYFSIKTGRHLRNWISYLDRYAGNSTLFPTQSGNNLQIGNYEGALRRAGKQIGLAVHPHQLRNCFAKYYLLNGGDLATLSMILGHSSVEITREAYLDFTDKEVSRNYQKHSPLANMDI